MAKWSKLPAEMLEIIFGHLNNVSDVETNLQQCSLTCRNWRPPAQKILFSKITLYTLDDLLNFKKLLENRDFGKLVKKLSYSYTINEDDIEKDEDKKSLTILFRLLPNLEELRTRTGTDFYSRLHKLLLQGVFPNLKVFPTPNVIDEDNLYIDCLYLVKDRLAEMELVQHVPNRRDTITKMKNELHIFKSMKAVTLFLTFESLTSGFDYLESIYKDFSLPLLLKIEFHLSFEAPENTNHLQPYTSVKSLQIECRQVQSWIDDVNGMLYIEKMFPNLDHLSISISDLYYWSVRSSVTPSFESTLRFLNYMFKIPNFLVGGIVTNDNTLRIINALYDRPGRTLFYRSSHALNLVYQQNLDHLGKRMETLGFAYDNQQKIFETKVTFITNDKIKCTSFFDLLEKFGQCYHQITLNYIPKFKDTTIFDHIIQYCTKLDTLILLNDTNLGRFFTTQNHHVKSITMSKFSLQPNLFTRLASCFPNLERLTVSDCIHTKNNKEINMEINMPNISFQYFKIVIDFDVWYMANRVIVKVVTEVEGPDRYYCLYAKYKNHANKTGFRTRHVAPVKDQKEEDYLEGIENNKCVVYTIRCKSLKTLSLTNSSVFKGFSLY